MAFNDLKSLTLENANIRFRNFSGKEDQWGNEYRTFNVDIPDELVPELEKASWPVKAYKVREEGDKPQYFIKVRASFKYEDKSPEVILITDKGRKIKIKEEGIHKLDSYVLTDIDMTLVPSFRRDRATGKWVDTPTIYLSEFYAKLVESKLAKKYGAFDEDEESDEEPWD